MNIFEQLAQQDRGAPQEPEARNIFVEFAKADIASRQTDEPLAEPPIVTATKRLVLFESPVKSELLGVVPVGWQRGGLEPPGQRGARKATSTELQLINATLELYPDRLSPSELQTARQIQAFNAPMFHKMMSSAGRPAVAVAGGPFGLARKVPGWGDILEDAEAAMLEPTQVYGEPAQQLAEEVAATPGDILALSAMAHGVGKAIKPLTRRVAAKLTSAANKRLDALARKARMFPTRTGADQLQVNRWAREAVQPMVQRAGKVAEGILRRNIPEKVAYIAAGGTEGAVGWTGALAVKGGAEAWVEGMSPEEAAQHVWNNAKWGPAIGGALGMLEQGLRFRTAGKMKGALRKRFSAMRRRLVQASSEARNLSQAAQQSGDMTLAKQWGDTANRFKYASQYITAQQNLAEAAIDQTVAGIQRGVPTGETRPGVTTRTAIGRHAGQVVEFQAPEQALARMRQLRPYRANIWQRTPDVAAVQMADQIASEAIAGWYLNAELPDMVAQAAVVEAFLDAVETVEKVDRAPEPKVAPAPPAPVAEPVAPAPEAPVVKPSAPVVEKPETPAPGAALTEKDASAAIERVGKKRAQELTLKKALSRADMAELLPGVRTSAAQRDQFRGKLAWVLSAPLAEPPGEEVETPPLAEGMARGHNLEPVPAPEGVAFVIRDLPSELDAATSGRAGSGAARRLKAMAKADALWEANPIFTVDENRQLVAKRGGIAYFPHSVGMSLVQAAELQPADKVWVDFENLAEKKLALPRIFRPGADQFRMRTPEGAEEPWWGTQEMAVQLPVPSSYAGSSTQADFPRFVSEAVADAEIALTPKPIMALIPGEKGVQKLWQFGESYIPDDQFRFVDKQWPGATWKSGPNHAVAFSEGAPKAVVLLEGLDALPDGTQIGTRKARRVKPPKVKAVSSIREVPSMAEEEVWAAAGEPIRDWPDEIEPVGDEFWAELMGAARRLCTPARYKALRKSVLGSFHPDKPGIRLGKVTDALTGSHELGHAIDWLMNDKKYPSSITGRFGLTKGERALRAELAAVSRILRPRLWRATKEAQPGTYSYVRRHTELMGDFYSMFILNPAQAQVSAPTVFEQVKKRLGGYGEVREAVEELWANRQAGPEYPAIREHLLGLFDIDKDMPSSLLTEEGRTYDETVKKLVLAHGRQLEVFRDRMGRDRDRVHSLAVDVSGDLGISAGELLEDWRVIAENGKGNPRTGKLRVQIEAQLTPKAKKAIERYQAYMERARAVVDSYLRGYGHPEYIKFLENYFIHFYKRSSINRRRSAVLKWSKKSPQTKKRVLPTLEDAIKLGLEPLVFGLDEGLELWGNINYRVMANIAILKTLPNILNDEGVSIIQKPNAEVAQDWPRLDHYAIRKVYAHSIGNRGILLWQGSVAVDPQVYKYINALLVQPFQNRALRVVTGLNAVMKAFMLHLFSFFHHAHETFSAFGSLRARVFGLWGEDAKAFGKSRPFLWVLPPRIGPLAAGKELEKTPEFVQDYLLHGGRLGYITGQQINAFQQMLDWVADLATKWAAKPGTRRLATKPAAATAKAMAGVYRWSQHFLWDNVGRAKLLSYYVMLNWAAGKETATAVGLPRTKEMIIQYLNDNFGGQEWMNSMFRDPRFRQILFNLFLSFDWTWSQIKTMTWPFRYGRIWGGTPADRRFMRAVGRRHWLGYLLGLFLLAQSTNYALNGKFTWDNEYGHKWDIDYTNAWRFFHPSWREEGDLARRYTPLGKAAREVLRWVTSAPQNLRYKLSPVANEVLTQITGSEGAGGWTAAWAQETRHLEGFESLWERGKHVAASIVPFSLQENNALFAFPLRKGMTDWKAVRVYQPIFESRARHAYGGLTKARNKMFFVLAHQGRSDRDALLRDIAEACEINGVDAEKAARAALAGVRSKWYRKFQKAAESQDIQEMERVAHVLFFGLGVSERGMQQSMRRRGIPPEALSAVGIKPYKKQ